MIEIINSIRKYNFWDINPIDLGYSRTSYTNKIGQYIGNKLVKVLVGQRRAGKSYILRQIASKLIAQGVKSETFNSIRYYDLVETDYKSTGGDSGGLIFITGSNGIRYT